MKSPSLSLILMIAIACTQCFAAEVGKPAPKFEAKLSDGRNFSLATSQQKVLIIHFWATWCDACKVEMDVLNTYYLAHRSDDLKIIAVNLDSPKNEIKARELMKSFAIQSAFGRDAQFKGYGRIWRLPLTFVIGRDKTLLKDGWVQNRTVSTDDLNIFVTPLLK